MTQEVEKAEPNQLIRLHKRLSLAMTSLDKRATNFMERVSPLKSPKSIQLFCASVEATFPLDFESTITAPS